MNKNVERGKATRTHLVDVATRLFATYGYGDTSIEMVLAESGVSRGSLYHHFAGKDALFWAVLEEIAVRVGGELAEAERDAADPVAALRAGCLTWIRMAIDPVVQRIVLIDAPAVLGWQRWRELDEQGTLGIVRQTVAFAAAAGRVPQGHVDVFAHIVMAAINEVAQMIARADHPAEALSAAESALADFMDRMLGDQAATVGEPGG